MPASQPRARIFRGEDTESDDDDGAVDPAPSIPVLRAVGAPPSVVSTKLIATVPNSSESIIAKGISANVLPMVANVSRTLSELLRNQKVSAEQQAAPTLKSTCLSQLLLETLGSQQAQFSQFHELQRIEAVTSKVPAYQQKLLRLQKQIRAIDTQAASVKKRAQALK
jgi:hypothetical protein